MTAPTLDRPGGPATEFGRFVGTVIAEWTTPDRVMRLTADFAYLDPAGARWDAKAGSEIDGASIPPVLWSVVGSPYTGQYRNASVVHDVACKDRVRPWSAVHRMFYYACRCGGLGELKAKMMFAAVYHFGPRWGVAPEAAPAAQSKAGLAELRSFVAGNPSLEAIEGYRMSAGAPAARRTSGRRAGRSPDEYLGALGRKGGLEGLEAAGSPAGKARTAEELRDPVKRRQRIETLERRFEAADRLTQPPDSATANLRRMIVQTAEPALAKLGTHGGAASLDPPERIALEALIQLHNRPSIVIRDGDLTAQPTDPDMEDWQATLVTQRAAMKKTIASVGRIDLDGGHVGTGFVVAPGVVMTNRHVLEILGAETSRDGRKEWVFEGKPTIDFLRELDSTATLRFAITGVRFAGRTPIHDVVDFKKLDLALLEVEPTNGEGRSLPPPLSLAKSAAPAGDKVRIYTVGYPAEPSQLPLDGSARDQDVIEAMQRIFGAHYGVKRLALGAINRILGSFAEDERHWTMGHDATTLGGNSGSCVLPTSGVEAVLALHFSGTSFEYNAAHVLASVPALRESPAPVAFDWI